MHIYMIEGPSDNYVIIQIGNNGTRHQEKGDQQHKGNNENVILSILAATL